MTPGQTSILLRKAVEEPQPEPQFRGRRVVTDGNKVISRVAYKVNGGIAIYTITPSSPFGEESARHAAAGDKNIYGAVPQVFMACDEAAAAAFVQGLAAKGVGSATCSSSQGILLMIPEMYNCAGQLLPITFYIGARDLSRHSLTIFAGHSDVYAVRDTGIAILFAADAQELQDIGAIAERLKWETSLPVAVVYDGFFTTHRQTQVQELPEEFFWAFMPHEKMIAHKQRALDPAHPSVWGANENPDGYMQAGLAQRPHTLAVARVLPSLMTEFETLTGRAYTPYAYTGHPAATDVIVAAGSSVTTLRATVHHLLQKDPERRIGVINVRAFRPFLVDQFIAALPPTVARIAVLDRSMTHTAQDEPLCADVRAAVVKSAQGFAGVPQLAQLPVVTGGIYGVAGKDFHPGSVVEVFEHLARIARGGNAWTGFTVGVVDDVMGTSLPSAEVPDIFEGVNVRQGRIVAYGSDGTVSMVKGAAEVYARQPNPDEAGAGLYVASTADYDSRKAGGVTVSHFRVSTRPLDESFQVRTPDYVAVHHPALLHKRAGILDGIRQGGLFVVNTAEPPAQVFAALPADLQQTIIDRDVTVWAVDAFRIAAEQGLGNKISMIMQRVLFAKFGLIEPAVADTTMTSEIEKAFASKGQEVVDRNINAFRQALASLARAPVTKGVDRGPRPAAATASAPVDRDWMAAIAVRPPDPEGFRNCIQARGVTGRGGEVPVGAYFDYARGGARPTDTWKGLVRSFAANLPAFAPDQCNECGDCVFMCPTGGALVQVILSATQQQALAHLSLGKVFRNTGGFSLDASGGLLSLERLRPSEAYGVAVDPNLCTGCGICAAVCRKDAIRLQPVAAEHYARLEQYREILQQGQVVGGDIDLSIDFSRKRHTLPEMESLPNYVGTSGACAGCFEPHYVSKFLQLYPYTVISNATGCSSIWGAQAYETPYSTDHQGYGAAWVNPLFENNAAVGGGIALGIASESDQAIISRALVLEAIATRPEIAARGSFTALREHLAAIAAHATGKGTTLGDRFQLVTMVKQVQGAIDAALHDVPKGDVVLRTHLQLLRATVTSYLDKTTLIVGGDGWAFDIGLQMLVHVLQSDLDVVAMVLVTDAYSNTGGQMSKATPRGMEAAFAPGGKDTQRYPLGLSVAYGAKAFVGQVNLAFPNHLIATYKQAAEFDGPSLLLCYVPCMNEHKYAEALVPEQARRATTTRYWPLWTFNPQTGVWSIDGNPESQREVAKIEGDFIGDFCRREGRFRSQFGAGGAASEQLHRQAQENLRIWRLLQKNAGVEAR